MSHFFQHIGLTAVGRDCSLTRTDGIDILVPAEANLTPELQNKHRRTGYAWLALVAALALHVADEAMTGFLTVYNPTVLAIREQVPWLPLPVFRFGVWLAGLIAAVVLLSILSVFVFEGRRWARRGGFVFATLMLLNAVGHTAGTLLGRTVDSVRFSGPMPGFHSSPLLAAAAIYLLYSLRRSNQAQPAHYT